MKHYIQKLIIEQGHSCCRNITKNWDKFTVVFQ